MGRDELDLAARELGLTLIKVATELICCKNTRISLTPRILNAPITDKHYERIHPAVDSASVLEDSPHLRRVSACLLQTILFFMNTPDEQAFAISESDLALAAAELRFNREDTRRPDHDVIDIEAVSAQIVERLITRGSLRSFRTSATLSSPRSPRFKLRKRKNRRRKTITHAPVAMIAIERTSFGRRGSC